MAKDVEKFKEVFNQCAYLKYLQGEIVNSRKKDKTIIFIEKQNEYEKLENELINMYDERLTDKDIEFLKFISEQIWGSEALPLKTIKKFDEFIEKLEGKWERLNSEVKD